MLAAFLSFNKRDQKRIFAEDVSDKYKLKFIYIADLTTKNEDYWMLYEKINNNEIKYLFTTSEYCIKYPEDFIFLISYTNSTKLQICYIDKQRFFVNSQRLIKYIRKISSNKNIQLDISTNLSKVKTKTSNKLPNKMFGYNISKNRGKTNISINMKEAKIIKQIFMIATEGLFSIRQIQRKIQDNGTGLSMTQKVLGPVQIHNILKQPYYCGCTMSNEKLLVQSNIFPAIVSQDIWEYANKSRKKRSAINDYTKKNNIVCLLCEKPYYICKNNRVIHSNNMSCNNPLKTFAGKHIAPILLCETLKHIKFHGDSTLIYLISVYESVIDIIGGMLKNYTTKYYASALEDSLFYREMKKNNFAMYKHLVSNTKKIVTNNNDIITKCRELSVIYCEYALYQIPEQAKELLDHDVSLEQQISYLLANSFSLSIYHEELHIRRESDHYFQIYHIFNEEVYNEVLYYYQYHRLSHSTFLSIAFKLLDNKDSENKIK